MSPPPPPPATVRVLIVDDDPLVRSGLRLILGSTDDLEVVGEAADGTEAASAADRCRPNVVLVDIRMPHRDGIAVTAELTRRADAPRVVVLTTFDLDDYVLEALRAGASGFLVKDMSPTDIIDAIRTVAHGDAMLAPRVTRTLIERFADPEATARRQAARDALGRLTDREHDVALAVGRGASNAEIGAELHLAEATVKTYVSKVLDKLDVDNRVQVALRVHDARA